MTRKITSGPIRDKDRTKLKLLTAVGLILKKKGFSGISVTNIANKAEVNRKLIYAYFGSLEKLVQDYLNSRDYWSMSPEKIDGIIEESKKDFGKQTAYLLLENQFEALMSNEEMRKIILWGLSENLTPLKQLNTERERFGEQFFSKLTDDHFKESEKNFRAITGILVGGVYYLTLQAKMSGETMCGIDITTERGSSEIKKTLRQIIDWAYA
ncbi:TetR family transcriptional regulator [Chryseobacterium sp. IHB B 17019]|uniref:TetR/AcrR family transcriptional regulator n=1 Tax=Chryseobacterium sp. IHB B 17019 TaxID=1721091 RepID=UPI0007226504|nr:TetR/AcrR family transcriptional regulator [Chryseobacterium sp. IHB B 17019]ALR32441.1 TetR family transcriptional regulator [Chryseobacterium sp. IHB B 17019]